MDFLWGGTNLHSAALCRSVRRLHPVAESSVAWRGVCCVVLDVDRVRGTGSNGNIPDAAVPRWTAAVSSVADRGMGGNLWSYVGHAWRRFHADSFAHSFLR